VNVSGTGHVQQNLMESASVHRKDGEAEPFDKGHQGEGLEQAVV
jgi:hypothetical protein